MPEREPAAAGGARDCSDTDSCTTDSCDETNNHLREQRLGGVLRRRARRTGTEQCDDGNMSNADACLNTCENATCGDGFVRTGVEQCDAGAANSNAPNAACRLDCTPRRCGDGIVDTQTEQCDDGSTTSGDGCSAACGAEPPATAELIPGRGSTSVDCGLEWAYNQPALDRRGVPSVKQTCRDGDPACDIGTTPGECTFHVWVCANNTDPRLPSCTPGSAGIGNVVAVEARKPSEREAGLRPVDNVNRQQVIAAAAAAETSAQDSCGPRMAIRVPLKNSDDQGREGAEDPRDDRAGAAGFGRPEAVLHPVSRGRRVAPAPERQRGSGAGPTPVRPNRRPATRAARASRRSSARRARASR